MPVDSVGQRGEVHHLDRDFITFLDVNERARHLAVEGKGVKVLLIHQGDARVLDGHLEFTRFGSHIDIANQRDQRHECTLEQARRSPCRGAAGPRTDSGEPRPGAAERRPRLEFGSHFGAPSPRSAGTLRRASSR